VLTYALSGILGYFIGSIPTAFLLVRWRSKVDIRDAGSGNVGALNSYQVTRSRFVGAGVLLLDLVKGFLAVTLAMVLLGGEFPVQAISGVAAVVGHNFSVWLGFKGGRGLATGAGVMFALAWPLVLIWGALWVVAFALTKNVNVGNAVASAVEMVGVLVLPASFLSMIVGGSSNLIEFRVFSVVLFIVILVKHTGPVREYILNLQEKHR
jgi:glycerol-3-phosphate acyltransferase PlsY